MRTTNVTVLCAAFMLAACTTIQNSTVDDLVAMQTYSSFDPLFYIGSDDRFHYFNHLKVKYWQKYRIPLSDLTLSTAFARDSGKSQVMWPGTLEKAREASPPDTSSESTLGK